jgi:two-component system, LytTR family, response regulator
MKITALIVDDEAHARQALRHLLQACEIIEIVGECEQGLAAIKTVQELSPDVMFLDIQMPKLDGFDVLELLGDAAPAVVFVTAHDDYAIQAFAANATDYLLKPVSAARLAQTLERLQQRLAKAPLGTGNNANLIQHHKQQQLPISRILIRDKAEVVVLPTADVIAIEAADDYVVIHSTRGNYIKQERLNNLEALLDPALFCRIHRSCIINLDFLTGIESEGRETRMAALGNNLQLPISRNGYGRLIKLL